MTYHEAPGFAWLEQDGRHVLTVREPSDETKERMRRLCR